MGQMITIGGGLTAYRSDPPEAADGTVTKGALIVIHEAWGLVDHIKNVADRFAAEGYLVVAPDVLTNAGVTPDVGLQMQALMFAGDEKSRTEAQPMLREKLAPAHVPEYAAWTIRSLRELVDYLEQQPGVDGRIAVTGFCFGGGYTFALAAAEPRVKAALPFYGYPPETTEIAGIRCPVLAFYGDLDENLMRSLPALTTAMMDAGIDFTPKVYVGARHAFFNDTNSLTYNGVAATDAWARALAFLDRQLARRA